MHSYEELFKIAMQGICYASHLARNAPLVTAKLKDDQSVVSLYDVSIQMIFCYLFRDSPVDILSEEEDNIFYKETLKILRESVGTSTEEHRYIHSFLKEHSISLDRMKPVIHSAKKTGNTTVVLDPIDGTRGFISGRSYSVVVSCIENNSALFSIISCPKEGIVHYKCSMNTSGTFGYPHRKRVKVYALGDAYKASYSAFLNTLSLHICMSAESAHSSSLVEKYLSRMREIYPIVVHRMDGQGKYAYVATQQMDIFLRLPSRKIEEKIWDHCAGIDMNCLSVVTDVYGTPLHPCTPPSYGVLASHCAIFHSISLSILNQLLI
ncbi:3'(2'), 5'-bisphosphate nucleotidase [Nematocida minor]|uniref:3'(2'), 5'-bisphosphate nucleotidase n=1 Tax=Nematocida minor TaxID=1912983 RepID=UPI00221EC9AD|nr:3'(2'), 5'-bisphosphate nucleotidase [Nematocida minor]KAI5191683.1 3'(2'), 5'-bisphosphate nucleotidase [Nematocida minor]